MSYIRIKTISTKNYRSFGEQQYFVFPDADYAKPIPIVGYNNCGKTNLINAILYSLGVNFVSKDTFTINDFHNRKIENIPWFQIEVDSSEEDKFDSVKKARLKGFHRLKIYTDANEIEGSKIESLNSLNINHNNNEDYNYQAFGATRYFQIFYINFHNIKDEIVTQKSSWGNLKSFLGKHIQKIIDSDNKMKSKKGDFEIEINNSTQKVLEGSILNSFIEIVKKNYKSNLRNNDCTIDFGLPNYEDIFLKMLFKVGLNGDNKNLIPIDHFGDGFISMFVMAVIQAIAEFNNTDKCLFIFEEPESFLHENHQEYFYKTVLCGLAENGHQVIYTTHSDKMIDPFDTKGMIRLEMNENNQTIKKYNNTIDFNFTTIDEDTGNVITYSHYNEFIKTIEPNLSRILFSKKVILVEGPNDVLVYKHVISKKVSEYAKDNFLIKNKEKFADTFMNFENISIVCHHGKTTALYLIEICKHFNIEFYVITDWDFEANEIDVFEIKHFQTLSMMQQDTIYKRLTQTQKGMLTNNWNLLNAAGSGNIHFNIKKLEDVIGYKREDKSSLGIWELLNSVRFEISDSLFPNSLVSYLNLSKLIIDEAVGVNKNNNTIL